MHSPVLLRLSLCFSAQCVLVYCACGCRIGGSGRTGPGPRDMSRQWVAAYCHCVISSPPVPFPALSAYVGVLVSTVSVCVCTLCHVRKMTRRPAAKGCSRHHDRDDPNSRSQKIYASADSRVRSLSSGKARPPQYSTAKGDYLPFQAHLGHTKRSHSVEIFAALVCSGLLQSCSSSGTHTHSKPRKLFANEHTFETSHISFHAPDQHQTCNACVRTLDIINAHAHKIRELRGSPLDILPYPQPADWLLR